MRILNFILAILEADDKKDDLESTRKTRKFYRSCLSTRKEVF